jgi:hypothetical protein
LVRSFAVRWKGGEAPKWPGCPPFREGSAALLSSSRRFGAENDFRITTAALYATAGVENSFGAAQEMVGCGTGGDNFRSVIGLPSINVLARASSSSADVPIED